MAPSPELETYLNDHLAGSAAGGKLARRIADGSTGTAHEALARQLLREVEGDREALIEIMGQLEVRRRAMKQLMAGIAEQFSRVKLSSFGSGSPALARLLQTEALTLGVTGKHRLWVALQLAGVERLTTVDLDGLIERAERQLEVLERLREHAASEALAEPARV